MTDPASYVDRIQAQHDHFVTTHRPAHPDFKRWGIYWICERTGRLDGYVQDGTRRVRCLWDAEGVLISDARLGDYEATDYHLVPGRSEAHELELPWADACGLL